MSVPWIGARPPTAPPEQKQAAGWEALCPCGALAWWRSTAAPLGDYSATRIEYVIECKSCSPSVEEAKEIA